MRVDFNEQCISATYPDGRVESIAWTVVVRITIETNDRGPWDTDVWWIVEGERARCVYPLGATGDSEALAEYSKRFPVFDDMKVVEAMGCTSNARFVCWERVHAS